MFAACPGDSNILLTEAQPELKEVRWYNASNFTCYWRVRAPADHFIEVKLEQLEGFKCDQSCYTFIEVKYASMANSGRESSKDEADLENKKMIQGPRFCCELPTEPLLTEVQGHEMIIIASGYKRAGNYTVGLHYSITK
jgi:hypothetical protein